MANTWEDPTEALGEFYDPTEGMSGDLFDDSTYAQLENGPLAWNGPEEDARHVSDAANPWLTQQSTAPEPAWAEAWRNGTLMLKDDAGNRIPVTIAGDIRDPVNVPLPGGTVTTDQSIELPGVGRTSLDELAKDPAKRAQLKIAADKMARENRARAADISSGLEQFERKADEGIARTEEGLRIAKRNTAALSPRPNLDQITDQIMSDPTEAQNLRQLAQRGDPGAQQAIRNWEQRRKASASQADQLRKGTLDEMQRGITQERLAQRGQDAYESAINSGLSEEDAQAARQEASQGAAPGTVRFAGQDPAVFNRNDPYELGQRMNWLGMHQEIVRRKAQQQQQTRAAIDKALADGTHQRMPAQQQALDQLQSEMIAINTMDISPAAKRAEIAKRMPRFNRLYSSIVPVPPEQRPQSIDDVIGSQVREMPYGVVTLDKDGKPTGMRNVKAGPEQLPEASQMHDGVRVKAESVVRLQQRKTALEGIRARNAHTAKMQELQLEQEKAKLRETTIKTHETSRQAYEDHWRKRFADAKIRIPYVNDPTKFYEIPEHHVGRDDFIPDEKTGKAAKNYDWDDTVDPATGKPKNPFIPPALDQARVDAMVAERMKEWDAAHPHPDAKPFYEMLQGRFGSLDDDQVQEYIDDASLPPQMRHLAELELQRRAGKLLAPPENWSPLGILSPEATGAHGNIRKWDIAKAERLLKDLPDKPMSRKEFTPEAAGMSYEDYLKIYAHMRELRDHGKPPEIRVYRTPDGRRFFGSYRAFDPKSGKYVTKRVGLNRDDPAGKWYNETTIDSIPKDQLKTTEFVGTLRKSPSGKWTPDGNEPPPPTPADAILRRPGGMSRLPASPPASPPDVAPPTEPPPADAPPEGVAPASPNLPASTVSPIGDAGAPMSEDTQPIIQSIRQLEPGGMYSTASGPVIYQDGQFHQIAEGPKGKVTINTQPINPADVMGQGEVRFLVNGYTGKKTPIQTGPVTARSTATPPAAKPKTGFIKAVPTPEQLKTMTPGMDIQWQANRAEFEAADRQREAKYYAALRTAETVLDMKRRGITIDPRTRELLIQAGKDMELYRVPR